MKFNERNRDRTFLTHSHFIDLSKDIVIEREKERNQSNKVFNLTNSF